MAIHDAVRSSGLGQRLYLKKEKSEVGVKKVKSGKKRESSDAGN